MPIWLFSLFFAFNLVSCVAWLSGLRGKRHRANDPSHDPFGSRPFHLWSAIDQTIISYWYAEDVAKKSRSPGDYLDLRSQEWLGLSRMMRVWAVFAIVQLLASIIFSFRQCRPKILVIVGYVLLVWSAVIPLLRGNHRHSSARDVSKSFPQLLFYVNPALLSLFLSKFFNLGLTKLDSAGRPLSLLGIASQTAVHGIAGLYWASMVGPSLMRTWRKYSVANWPVYVMLWNRFLWPLVDHGIFAVLQGRRLWAALRVGKATSKDGRHKMQAVDDDEDEDGDGDGAAILPLTG